MKKFVFIMPLMAISLLVNCGGSNAPQTIEHFVSFDSNGGDHVNTQRVKDGGSAKEPTPAPKKTDYTFAGWYLNEDLSGDVYDFSKSVTGDITLFAKWTGGPQPVIPTYTIDFQGENCTSTLDTSKQYHTGDLVEFTINVSNSTYKLPEKINVSGVSTFDYDNQSGEVSFTVESKDMGVIAKADVIEPTVQHTVTFVLNGATSAPIDPVKVNEGDPYPSDKIPTDPTNPGHAFEGWSDKENTKSIIDLTKAPTINSDLVLYAWWGNAQSVDITFNANGGYFDNTTTTTTKTVPTTYGQVPVAPTPTKVVAGQTSTFKGWHKPLTPAKPESEGGTTTYNAVWGDVVNKCHVTFDGNGGTITAGGDPRDVDYGGKIDTAPTVTRDGYDATKVEWYDAATGGNLFTFGATEVTTNLTLYAHWGSIKTYTVVFNANGGTYPTSEGGQGTVTRNNVPYNTMPTIPAAPTKVDSTGVITYTFTGYDKNVVPVTGNEATITYTAKWSEVTNKCHVTFDGNGGTISSGGDPVDVDYGSTIDTPPVVTRDGYGETTGWYDAATGGNKFTFGTTEVTTNLTLYAHWGEIITHKITITGAHIQSGNPLTFVHNKFDSISYTVSVESGYKLTGGYSLNPADSATVEFTDTKTISITPKTNYDITITLGTEEDIKYYYSITASGEHISYYKDEAMNVPLNHAVAYVEEDLVFYMLADLTENSSGYIPPTTLDAKVGNLPIGYTIEPVSGEYQNVMKKVTIAKEYITGDINIHGDAISVDYYNIEFPYFYGLKEITYEDSVFEYDKDATIEFNAKDSITNEDLITAENIYVNFTGGAEESNWICAADDAFTSKGKFEHTQDDKYILTIYADVVDTSINTIQIIARAKSYHEILNEFTWEEINQMSGTSLAAKLFIAGDIKTTNEKTFRIIGFNKDELVESTNEDPKYAGITFECVNSLASVCWFDEDVADIHDFRVSDLNTTCQENGDAYKAIPNEIMQYIKEVKKQITIYENGEWNTEATYDTQLFPLSNDEIEGNDDGTYEYYKTDSQNRRKKGVDYWLRIPYIYDDETPAAYYINTYGEVSTAYAGYYPKNVAPAFCI